jgi:hypothetical protein
MPRSALDEALARKARLDRDGSGPEVFGWERYPDLAALRQRADEDGTTATRPPRPGLDPGPRGGSDARDIARETRP